jgi:hypothetical protein
MSFRDLYKFQNVVIRAYVRNAMFFATLPYHLMGFERAREEPTVAYRHVGRTVRERLHRRKDVRWLR